MAVETGAMQYRKPRREAPTLFKPKDPGEFGFEFIKYEKKDGIARVTINRPQVYNSYNLKALQEMTEAFDDVAIDDRIGVVILRGEGDKAFCTGGDVKEYAESIVQGKSQDMWGWMNYFVRAHDALRNCGKTTIAALNGIVVGDQLLKIDGIRIRDTRTAINELANLYDRFNFFILTVLHQIKGLLATSCTFFHVTMFVYQA